MAKKGYNIPIKTKIPLILIFSLCSIFIIPHFLRFVNKFDEIYIITFRKVEKSLPCVKGGGTAFRDGGIVKAEFYKKQPLSRLRRQLPLHKGAFFMFIFALSIFLTSTASVDTDAIISYEL